MSATQGSAAQQKGELYHSLQGANENCWNKVELLGDLDGASFAYEAALQHSPSSVTALLGIGLVQMNKQNYSKAIECFKRVLSITQNDRAWGALGHCYLMIEDLHNAWNAYQQALYSTTNPKDPSLWFGIGVLYDRCSSYENAEEAFSWVLKVDPSFEKGPEIKYRLGIIYKTQGKVTRAVEAVLENTPSNIAKEEVWLQLGHAYELQKQSERAKEAYEKALAVNPSHAKVLQQLGWLYHQNGKWAGPDVAVRYLTHSIDSDPSDSQSWYLLGRCYMTQRNYKKAYECYQQAVYRDCENPTFWCSIGVLYYQTNQYRYALDAYSRAIKLNPKLSEVWYDLGTLYESTDRIEDSLESYERAARLDPDNKHIRERLQIIRSRAASKPPNGAAEKASNEPMLSVAELLSSIDLPNESFRSQSGPSAAPKQTAGTLAALAPRLEPEQVMVKPSASTQNPDAMDVEESKAGPGEGKSASRTPLQVAGSKSAPPEGAAPSNILPAPVLKPESSAAAAADEDSSSAKLPTTAEPKESPAPIAESSVAPAQSESASSAAPQSPVGKEQTTGTPKEERRDDDPAGGAAASSSATPPTEAEKEGANELESLSDLCVGTKRPRDDDADDSGEEARKRAKQS